MEEVPPNRRSSVEIQGALRRSYHFGIKVVYIYDVPMAAAEIDEADSTKVIPGILVDRKTTFRMQLGGTDPSHLVSSIYLPPAVQSSSSVTGNIRISVFPRMAECNSSALTSLAIASGQWSRFRTDTNIPSGVFEKMFSAWLNNSVNGSIADEVFVAREFRADGTTSEEIGFVTVKLKGQVVHIGLLAVDAQYRRQGVAAKLMHKAMLWGLERTGFHPSTELSVVTQG